jgi:carbon-monoxide dehydrogenase large subunit
MEEDVAGWFNTEVPSVVLAAWGHNPELLQASHAKPLTATPVNNSVDVLFSFRFDGIRVPIAIGEFNSEEQTYPNGTHVCEVEIDPDTGHVEVAAYASVNDIGRVVSPTIVAGQIQGGAVQGIGQALCEAVRYDSDSGQMLTASFQDYAMPRADIASGFFQTRFDTSIPCVTNLLGVKGVGELGTIGATPATVNAVIDALDHAGLGRKAERIQMPLTAGKVWAALNGALG